MYNFGNTIDGCIPSVLLSTRAIEMLQPGRSTLPKMVNCCCNNKKLVKMLQTNSSSYVYPKSGLAQSRSLLLFLLSSYVRQVAYKN